MNLLIVAFFPWLVFLQQHKGRSAALCMALQISIVGWIPAVIWARSSASRVRADL
ncbi:YqaE/Pmp3 family membrane protein [Cupriavidus gilardii]|nr:YqaE/Pmp3 family membrane protein [Cupriavidus gilardii]